MRGTVCKPYCVALVAAPRVLGSVLFVQPDPPPVHPLALTEHLAPVPCSAEPSSPRCVGWQAEVARDAVVKAFKSLAQDVTEDQLIDKCQRMCQEHDLSPLDLAYKWEAHIDKVWPRRPVLPHIRVLRHLCAYGARYCGLLMLVPFVARS